MEQEIERKGLSCVIQFRCGGRGVTLVVETQPKSKGPGGQMRHNINIAACGVLWPLVVDMLI